MPAYMKRAKMPIDPTWLDQLRSALFYDPLTGAFRWLENYPRFGVCFGDYAGVVRQGYLTIKFKQRIYFAHRLAFVLMTGRWPQRCVDHIDRDKLNNAWGNLRDVTLLQNARN